MLQGIVNRTQSDSCTTMSLNKISTKNSIINNQSPIRSTQKLAHLKNQYHSYNRKQPLQIKKVCETSFPEPSLTKQ